LFRSSERRYWRLTSFAAVQSLVAYWWFAMTGRQTSDQSRPIYPFNLGQRIPASHSLRRTNPVATGVPAELREKLAPFCVEIGLPSIDPELMLRMLIEGYCYGQRCLLGQKLTESGHRRFNSTNLPTRYCEFATRGKKQGFADCRDCGGSRVLFYYQRERVVFLKRFVAR
jgi:hypothetical protein